MIVCQVIPVKSGPCISVKFILKNVFYAVIVEPDYRKCRNSCRPAKCRVGPFDSRGSVRGAMCHENIIIRAGWLIDGSGAAVQKDVQFICTDGAIRSIQEIPEPVSGFEKSAGSFLDFSDCTVLPGLIDCHVHLALSSGGHRDNFIDPSDAGNPDLRERISQNLKQYLAVGVLAVRDGGDPGAFALQYKKATSGFNDNFVHMCVTSHARHRPGRYGRLIGRQLPAEQTLAEAVLQEEKPVDHIKIINSGLNSLTDFGRQTEPQFDLDELQAAVQKAQNLGFKTMVHANGKTPVKIALDAGCDSIEHGFFMGKENMQRLTGSRTTWVPTAFTMKALRRRSKDRGENADVVQKNLNHQIKQIQIAGDLGVQIALGTDAGSAGVEHGQAFIREMRLFMDAGFSIEKVVQCASHNGALLLGLQGVGLLQKNMPASLIAVKGDPSHLPESLNQIKLVMYKGKQIKSNN